MGAHKNTAINNTFLLSILGTLAMLEVWNSMANLDYFRCMGILRNTATIIILMISTMVFMEWKNAIYSDISGTKKSEKT